MERKGCLACFLGSRVHKNDLEACMILYKADFLSERNIQTFFQVCTKNVRFPRDLFPLNAHSELKVNP